MGLFQRDLKFVLGNSKSTDLEIKIDQEDEGNEDHHDHVHPEDVDPDVDPVGPELGWQDGQLGDGLVVVVQDAGDVVAAAKRNRLSGTVG